MSLEEARPRVDLLFVARVCVRLPASENPHGIRANAGKTVYHNRGLKVRVLPALCRINARAQPRSDVRGRSRTTAETLWSKRSPKYVLERRSALLSALASTGHGASLCLPTEDRSIRSGRWRRPPKRPRSPARSAGATRPRPCRATHASSSTCVRVAARCFAHARAIAASSALTPTGAARRSNARANRRRAP